MHCRKARKLIFDNLDRLLGEKDRIELEAHLEGCRECEQDAEEVARSLKLLHELPEATPGDNFNWKVRLALAREKRNVEEKLSSQILVLHRWKLRFSFAAAASFLVVIVGGYVFLQYSLISPSSPEKGALNSLASVPSLEEESGSQELAEAPVTPSRRMFGERLVSGGYGAPGEASNTYSPIEEKRLVANSNPDSLITSKLQEMRWRYRMKRMEQQIEVLQMYLRNCQTGKE